MTQPDPRAPTPGPWTAHHRHVGATPNDDEMAGLGWEIDGPPEASSRGQFRRAADAHLVAAVPDLLAACKAIERLLLGVALPGPVHLSIAEGKAIEAAIAKAKGETP